MRISVMQITSKNKLAYITMNMVCFQLADTFGLEASFAVQHQHKAVHEIQSSPETSDQNLAM